MQNGTLTPGKSSNLFIVGAVILIGIALLLTYCHKKTHEPKVYFGNLNDSAKVESPFKVEMKAENLVVEPATNGVSAGHGHFHIIIDSPLPRTGERVPMDSLHLHYGKGQTDATLDLSEGEHTLILQFADGNHFPSDPQITQVVHINVTKRHLPVVAMDPVEQPRKDEAATRTKSLSMNEGATQNNSPVHHAGKASIRPDSITNTPPPIDPGHGGGVGSGGGTGGSMGAGH